MNPEYAFSDLDDPGGDPIQEKPHSKGYSENRHRTASRTQLAAELGAIVALILAPIGVVVRFIIFSLDSELPPFISLALDEPIAHHVWVGMVTLIPTLFAYATMVALVKPYADNFLTKKTWHELNTLGEDLERLDVQLDALSDIDQAKLDILQSTRANLRSEMDALRQSLASQKRSQSTWWRFLASKGPVIELSSILFSIALTALILFGLILIGAWPTVQIGMLGSLIAMVVFTKSTRAVQRVQLRHMIGPLIIIVVFSIGAAATTPGALTLTTGQWDFSDQVDGPPNETYVEIARSDGMVWLLSCYDATTYRVPMENTARVRSVPSSKLRSPTSLFDLLRGNKAHHTSIRSVWCPTD